MKHDLSRNQIEQFVTEGYCRVERAFPRAVAEEALRILWRESGCAPDDPGTWTRPVVRLAGFGGGPFRAAANTPILHRAFDQLVGAGRWLVRDGLGSFVIRFPSMEDPGDTGWHIDVSFLPDEREEAAGHETGDYSLWRANLASRGRALLMLFLFSEVGVTDAPTRIRAGSHLVMARRLAAAGEAGLSAREMDEAGFDDSAHLPEVLATGEAGTVFLCHPFLVHAAQANRSGRPRFMSQPPLVLAGLLKTLREDGGYSPVERAVRAGLGLEP